MSQASRPRPHTLLQEQVSFTWVLCTLSLALSEGPVPECSEHRDGVATYLSGDRERHCGTSTTFAQHPNLSVLLQHARTPGFQGSRGPYHPTDRATAGAKTTLPPPPSHLFISAGPLEKEEEEVPQLMRTKSDASCIIQRRSKSRAPGEAQKIRQHRFSINGHFYNHKVKPPPALSWALKLREQELFLSTEEQAPYIQHSSHSSIRL